MPKTDFENLGGWIPNPEGVEAIQSELDYPVFADAAQGLMSSYEKTDTHLWRYLVDCWPDYRRAAQQIGDCVGFGHELAATTLCAKWWQMNGAPPVAEAATETIYGGSRVEARGKTFGGWSDGSFGASAAKWMKDWGVVLRLDHSKETGNPEHDMRKYSGKKAKDFGAYGCGGKNDNGKLDKIAREHPVAEISQVRSFEDVAAAIAGSQCPVTICSMYGTDMRRDKYGYCRWNKSWAHCMVLLGIRFGSHPGALVAQSWGPNSASGPMGDEYTENLPEGGTPSNIAGFCWYIPPEDINKICKSDCWMISDVTNFNAPRIVAPDKWNDWENTWV